MTAAAPAVPHVSGFNISYWQGLPNEAAAHSKGARFAYFKDTAGVGYVNPRFLAQFRAAKAAGVLRGAFHYGRPDKSSGHAQAVYFHDRNGKWFTDGMTLPPALDIENTDDAPRCYGMSPAKIVAWIADFSNTMRHLTGHYPVIYTSPSWWRGCTANSTAFRNTNPLWLAHWSKTIGGLPGGWRHWTFWQYSVNGPLPGNQDQFNGRLATLRKLTVR